jgi:hypothetical protein
MKKMSLACIAVVIGFSTTAAFGLKLRQSVIQPFPTRNLALLWSVTALRRRGYG